MLLGFLGTIFLGLSIASFSLFGRDYYDQMMQIVEADFRDQFRRLRLRTHRLRLFLNIWLSFVLGVLVMLWVVFGLLILGFAVSALLFCMPWYIIRRMAQKRKDQIEDQLADAMVQLSSAIRAGLSLPQSLEILAQQTPHPICQEFQQISGEYQLGKPLDKCLEETKERLRSENFALFSAALEASRESGGRLNETVDRIAHSVRELQRLERKVKAETAQARKSAFYMALAPIIILAIYWFIVDRENTQRLFTTVWGQILLSVALVFNVTAYLWARKLLNPDI